MARLYQMQARDATRGVIVSWRVTGGPDWLALGYAAAGGVGTAQDVCLALIGTLPAIVVPIVCAITSPTSGATVTQDIAVLITGTLNRAGSVVVKLGAVVLGSGIVSGLSWSFLWTPTIDNIGVQIINATATDASNGTISDASGVAVTVAPSAVFPASITPLLRFDPLQPGYTDIAETTVATAPYGRVRSIPQPSPLTGSWTASSDDARLQRRAANTIAAEPLALDYPTHIGQYVVSPSGSTSSLSMNNATLAIAFRPLASFGAPQQALISYGEAWGFTFGGSQLAVRYSGGSIWYPGYVPGVSGTLQIDHLGVGYDGDCGAGDLIVVVIRFTASGIDLYIDQSDVVRTFSSGTLSVSGSAPGYLQIGNTGNGDGNALFGEACVVASAISDSDRLALVAYLKAVGVAPAYPVSQRYLGWMADSIGAGVGASRPASTPYRVLANLRATYPDVQMLNTSIGGQAVTPISGNNSTQYTSQSRHLSPSRSGSVVVIAFGSNDLVTHPLDADVDASIASLWALSDALRAQGTKTVIVAAPPRSGLMASTSQADYDHARARWNAAVLANWSLHADGFARTDLVTGYGFDGDSNGDGYTGDNVHPNNVGHGRAEPAITAVVSPLFA